MTSFKEIFKKTLVILHLYTIADNIHKVFVVIKQANLFKSFYYSFILLGSWKAFKLPIIVCRRVKFRRIGVVIIDGPIKPFMIQIGYNSIPAIDDNGQRTVFYNLGKIHFGGPAIVHPGAKIWVEKDAVLDFLGYNVIGANSFIACHKHIEFGLYSGFSWDCQVFDTDFHYMKDIIGNTVYNKVQEILIGNDVFIGNHVNIGKGTKLPNGTVVSSWSNVSGSFVKKGENTLFAGSKASAVDSGYYIAHGYKMYLDNQFGEEFCQKKQKWSELILYYA